MRLNLHFFARLRRELGHDTLLLDVPDGFSVREVAALLTQTRGLDLRGCMVAVNDEYAEPDMALSDGDEVAFLPPVAGGSGAAPDKYLLTTEPLNLAAAEAHLSCAAHGANAFFSGTVRSPNAGKEVEYIDYEGYEALSLRVMEKCAEQVRSEYGELSVYTAHRVGRLYAGESSLIIGISSPHRRAALDGCSALLDLLKAELPIWKHEQDDAGAHWVAGTAAHGTL